MLILDATNKSLEIFLGGTVLTNQLPWTTSYVDITTNTFNPYSTNGASNNTSVVTIMAAPAASTQRQLKEVSIFNADTQNTTVTVQLNSGGTTRIICRINLSINETLFYIDTDGFYVMSANGALKTTVKTVLATTAYRAISAGRTLDATDELVECIANSFTVTFPTAVGFTASYTVKNSGTGTITLATTASQTIDGSSTVTLNQYDAITVRSNGLNWLII